MLPFAVGVMVGPTPIVAMVLMLVTPRAKSSGITFVLAWALGIGLAGAILLAIAGPAGASSQGEPTDWVNWLKLALGGLLLLVGMRQWRGRPVADADVPMPKWMGALDSITPLKAGGLAILLGVINPKNLIFILGGVAAIAQTGVSSADQAVAWILFTIIATIGVAAPLVIYFVMGSRTQEVLDTLKTWMARNNTAVMAVLCLIIGVMLIGDAITGFST
jgi:hypothetical protein